MAQVFTALRPKLSLAIMAPAGEGTRSKSVGDLLVVSAIEVEALLEALTRVAIEKEVPAIGCPDAFVIPVIGLIDHGFRRPPVQKCQPDGGAQPARSGPVVSQSLAVWMPAQGRFIARLIVRTEFPPGFFRDRNKE